MTEKLTTYENALDFAKNNNVMDFGFSYKIYLYDSIDKNWDIAFVKLEAKLAPSKCCFWCECDGEEFVAIDAKQALIEIN